MLVLNQFLILQIPNPILSKLFLDSDAKMLLGGLDGKIKIILFIFKRINVLQLISFVPNSQFLRQK